VASDHTARLLELVEVWNSGDIERFVEALGPDFEFTPDPSFPDVATYRGEELRRWLREWADTWQGNRLEVLETSDTPRGRFPGNLAARGRPWLTRQSIGYAL
jgi:hypothetical protein